MMNFHEFICYALSLYSYASFYPISEFTYGKHALYFQILPKANRYDKDIYGKIQTSLPVPKRHFTKMIRFYSWLKAVAYPKYHIFSGEL